MPDRWQFDHLTTRDGGPYLRCIWCGEIKSPTCEEMFLASHHRKHGKDREAAQLASEAERTIATTL